MKNLAILFLAITLSACGVAQKAQYSALEKVGVHKRDILVDRIEKTTETQEETKEQFKSAYEELAELIKVDDKGLEKKYKKMAKAVEKSEEKAEELEQRIQSVDSVANALFDEWQEELSQYQSTSLRKTSEANLLTTKKRYAKIHRTMTESHAKVEPVLKVLQDNTLYLKHNLNARAVTSLSNEVIVIEDKVKNLIQQMEASINESKTFVSAMQNK
ncbi:DUF2959 domain-containing protein [Arenicella sp. 4NH20-0111]|uniref:DUF2959 family protein n=1 Tax=Arenicella sp. 4NH20-0111 TaxID=3127648 RepID=UPI00310ABBD5